MKNTITCLLFALLICFPVYAQASPDVILDRWVLNVRLDDNGAVEEIIQAEIDNSDVTALEGVTFVVPAARVTMIYDFEHTASFTGQVVEQQRVQDGIKIILNFNKSVEAGKKWNGRIGFTAENWAIKEGSNYSIEIPVTAPQAIVSGKYIDISATKDADIRSQVFLPKSVEAISVMPEPSRILFQYGHMVPTWFQDKLKNGDVISIKASFSGLLNKIVETDEKSIEMSARIQEVKKQGIDVSEAETHLRTAEDLNTIQALGSFWKKEDAAVLEYVGFANGELEQAENSLNASVKKGEEFPEKTEAADIKKTPGFGGLFLIFILLIAFMFQKK